MFEITLQYADGSTWFVGGFMSLEDAHAWADVERTRSYWVPSTQIIITERV